MKNYFSKPLLIVLGAALMLPAALLAQDEKDKHDKDKDKKGGEEVIIIRRGEKAEKVVVEVNGDKVTVNGKPLEEYKGDDVSVRRSKIKDAYAFNDFGNAFGGQNWNMAGGDNFKIFNVDSNRAMLGVTTDKTEKGIEIQDITKESGASKAGLKEGDVILKLDDKKIETPDELTKAIRSHKPGEKVTITYSRDGKEQKTTAELGRWKGSSVYSYTPDFKMDLGDLNVNPRVRTVPGVRTPFGGQSYSWSGGGPKLGLSVQDTDDGKGVKVIEVDEESNAQKAGIKEDDIITEVENKTVNSADEVAKIIKESKDKTSVMVKLTRGGKTQNIEVKIPRKLKTADL